MQLPSDSQEMSQVTLPLSGWPLRGTARKQAAAVRDRTMVARQGTVRNGGRSCLPPGIGRLTLGEDGRPGYIEKRPALGGALSWCNVLLENYL
jgi:hypothetical protein